MDGLEATEQINVEFVLVAKDYHIVMAVKRLTRAPIEEDGPDLQIVVCDTDSTAKHTLEVWNFILPLVQTEKDLLCCTPVEVEVAAGERRVPPFASASWSSVRSSVLLVSLPPPPGEIRPQFLLNELSTTKRIEHLPGVLESAHKADQPGLSDRV